MIKELTRVDALLDQILTNKEHLASGVKVRSRLGSDHKIEEFSGVPHERMEKGK